MKHFKFKSNSTYYFHNTYKTKLKNVKIRQIRNNFFFEVNVKLVEINLKYHK